LEPGLPPPSNATPDAAPDSSGGLGLKLLKGCGCLFVLVILAVGVAMLGDSEPASWGSALLGVVILLVIVGSSGLIGWWNR
jgi:hypothetical protein